MKTELKVYNSLSREKEVFEPINPPFVGMYVCGPTVYSDVHLGNCRTFISFDMIFRYLQFLGYKVRYVRNITDAGHLENDADEGEDKISKKARLEQIEPMEVVQRYTVDFHKILAAFNNLPPSIEPTATGHIIEQQEMITDLLNKGQAYEVNGSVYFDVEAYNNKYNNSYGELSGRNIDELLDNTRMLDGQGEKKNPRDFALWKKASPEHIMRWSSPWGVGFPGWHLECSVMSSKYLGDSFDIHGGGMDLKFPHHECEIAQSTAAHNGEQPVKYWLHGNMLTLNGARMSKSTGNTLLPGELFTGNTDKLSKAFHPIVVRFFILQAHYRSTLDFSNDALEAAEKGYKRLMEAMLKLESLETAKESSEDVEAMIDKFSAAMNDDFNTPILIANLFDAAKFINSVKDGKNTISEADKLMLLEAMQGFVFEVLGLKNLLEVGEGSGHDKEALDGAMNVLIDVRAQARQERNWGMSDFIRDELNKSGIELKDGQDGSTWSLK